MLKGESKEPLAPRFRVIKGVIQRRYMLKREPMAPGFRVIKRAIQRRYMLKEEPKEPIAPGCSAIKSYSEIRRSFGIQTTTLLFSLL